MSELTVEIIIDLLKNKEVKKAIKENITILNWYEILIILLSILIFILIIVFRDVIKEVVKDCIINKKEKKQKDKNRIETCISDMSYCINSIRDCLENYKIDKYSYMYKIIANSIYEKIENNYITMVKLLKLNRAEMQRTFLRTFLSILTVKVPRQTYNEPVRWKKIKENKDAYILQHTAEWETIVSAWEKIINTSK